MNHNPVSKTKSINVNHQSWVHRNQLKLGMYVVELDKPWEQTPFLFQGFFLDTPELIEQVQSECQYVLVQQQKSTTINHRSPVRFNGLKRTDSKAEYGSFRI